MITNEEVSDKLYLFLESLPKKVLLKVMLEALESMQSYNSQSFTKVICESLGSEKTEQDRWRIPSVKQVEKRHS